MGSPRVGSNYTGVNAWRSKSLQALSLARAAARTKLEGSEANVTRNGKTTSQHQSHLLLALLRHIPSQNLS